MSKQWYDDWEIGITGWDDGRARIDVSLPHHEVKKLSFNTTKEDCRGLANLLDRLLSQLTDTKITKVEVIDGVGSDRTTE